MLLEERSPTGIVEAEAGLAPALAALEARCFSEPWSERMIAAELASPQGLALAAVAPDAPSGAPGPGHRDSPYTAYAVLRTVLDEAELLRVGVLPACRRRGLAAALLAEAFARLAARSVTRCHLEVRADNRAALALYRALDFEEVGRRAGYYRDGCDALLLARDL